MKKNFWMPRWSISPSWSSANAPQGSLVGIGPVDSPPLGGGPVAHARVQAPARRDEQREARANHLVADAHVVLFVERHGSLLLAPESVLVVYDDGPVWSTHHIPVKVRDKVARDMSLA